MATIHTYKETKLNEMGMWIKSTDGGPEIYLEPGQARQLAESILAQTKPAQRSAPMVQRSAPTTQRSAPRPAAPARKSAPTVQRSTMPSQQKDNLVTGALQMVGKSSFTDPKWADHAKNLAKTRATKKFDSCLDELRAEGKSWNDCKATGQHFVDGLGNVTYVIAAQLE
jgi:hypothetical protein